MSYTGWLIYNGGLLTDKFMELNKWYIKSAKKHRIDLKPIANSELFIGVEEGELILEPDLKRPDFVLYLDKDIHLAKQISNLGVPVFNSPETIAICDNKISMHQKLAEAKLPQPTTLFAPMLFQQAREPNQAFLNHVAKTLGYPLVVKEAYGSFGEQVYLINNRVELNHHAKALINKPHLFQEYIASSHGKDLRIHIVGDRAVASTKRVSKNDFRANVTNGGEMFAHHPNQEFIDLAIKASQTVGANFSGVDLLYGPNGEPIICEVNSNAHIKNIYQATSIDVSDYIFEEILNQLNS